MPVAPPSKGRPAIWRGAAVVAALAAVSALGVWIGGRLKATPPADPVEFVVPPPAADTSFAPMPLPGLTSTAPQVGISPDGRTVAFVASQPDGLRKLWLRPLDSSTARAVDGTEGATSWPFWSPDSRYIVFSANRVLWKVDTSTSVLERLCKLPDEAPPVPFVTGAWGDDVVVFSIGPGGLYRAPVTGGDAQKLTTIPAARRESYHSWPQLLPGGRLLLFVRTDDTRTTGLYAATLDAPAIRRWLRRARARSMPPARFSGRSTIASSPSPSIPRRFGCPASPSPWCRPSFRAQAARRRSGRPRGRPSSTRAAEARNGSSSGSAEPANRSGILGAPGDYASFALSRDGSRVVAEVRRESARLRSTLVVLETSRTAASTLTAGELNDTDPRIGPDGDVAFARNTGDATGIVRSDIAGGPVTVLVPKGTLPVVWLEDWTGSTGGVIYRTGASTDAWQLMSGMTEPRRLTRAREPVEQVQLSPDGKWIA